MTRKPEGPMAEKAKALLKKQEQGINMGEARIHLGRFAKSFAQVNQKSKNAEQAASVPPPRKQKTYDDIEKEIEEVVPAKLEAAAVHDLRHMRIAQNGICVGHQLLDRLVTGLMIQTPLHYGKHPP